MYKVIYKYAQLNDYLIDSIKNNYFVFTSPSEFNDLYDCQLPVDISQRANKVNNEISKIIFKTITDDEEFTDEIKKVLLTDEIENKKAYFIKVILKLVLEQRVTCFSADFDSMPMWAHYANNHNGVCLKFEYPDNQMSIFSYLAKVNYVEKLPIIKLPDFEELPLPIITEDPNSKYIGKEYDYINQLLLTKQKKWEYENEYRLVFLKNQTKIIDSVRGRINYPPAALTGVYFGYRVNTNSFMYQKAVGCFRNRAHRPELKLRRKDAYSFGSYWEEIEG